MSGTRTPTLADVWLVRTGGGVIYRGGVERTASMSEPLCHSAVGEWEVSYLSGVDCTKCRSSETAADNDVLIRDGHSHTTGGQRRSYVGAYETAV